MNPATPGTVVVSTLPTLKSALASAVPGSVIYVQDSADIIVEFEDTPLLVNGGVTLASGRGRNGSRGARIRMSQDDVGAKVITVAGSNARVTGLRVRGPDGDLNPPGNDDPALYGIWVNHDVTGTEIDNNELYHFNASAVSLPNGTVKNNNIHHNRKHRWGYGITVRSALRPQTSPPTPPNEVPVIAQGNVFNANRHAIAGSGLSGHDDYSPWNNGERYIFKRNVILSSSFDQDTGMIDMHAECERAAPSYGSPYAASFISIRENMFLSANAMVGIRGVPLNGFEFSDNRYLTDDFVGNTETGVGAGWLQFHAPITEWDSAEIATTSAAGRNPGTNGEPHCKERYEPTSLALAATLDIDAAAENCMSGGGLGQWVAALRAEDTWRILGQSSFHADDLLFGHFNNDAKTDVFRADGTHWQVSYGGINGWTEIRTSNRTKESLRLADFDGDGRTDVFTAYSGEWRVSWSGTSDWQSVFTSNREVNDLQFGDFNGDGRADVLRHDSAGIFVSFAGATRTTPFTPWRKLRLQTQTGDDVSGSLVTVANLHVGRFNADATDDLFFSHGGSWYVLYGNANPSCSTSVDLGCAMGLWDRVDDAIESSSTQLRFGDVNGDGRTDVLVLHLTTNGNDKIKVKVVKAWGEVSELVEHPDNRISEYGIGDFNGDGSDDLFVSMQPPS